MLISKYKFMYILQINIIYDVFIVLILIIPYLYLYVQVDHMIFLLFKFLLFIEKV